MRKVFNVILKILQSIVAFPFCILCGISIGVLYGLGLMLSIPCWVISDIWGYGNNE